MYSTITQTKNLVITATIMITTLALALVSCTKDENMVNGSSADNAPLQIASARLQGSQPQTRAEAVGVLQTGSIGLFRTQGTGYKETLDNKRYTYSTAKGWQPYSATDTVFLFLNPTDVYAYYPYDAKHTDKTALALTSGLYTGTADDLSKHDANDICYGSSKNLTALSKGIDLTLSHAMALLRLNFTRLNYASSKCNITALKIENTKLVKTATLDITKATDAVTPVTYAAPSLDYTKSVQVPATGSINIDVLLIPCTLTSTTTFKFTVDGKGMTLTVDATRLSELQAGKIHQLNLNVHAASVTLSSVDIIDWTAKWEEGKEPADSTLYTKEDYIQLAGAKWALANLEYHPEYFNYSFGKDASAAGTSMEWNALTDDAGEGNNGTAWNRSSDPCSRLEPKGTWVTPSSSKFTALASTTHVSGTCNGVAGVWYGTNDIKQVEKAPDRYLFLPTQSYWTKSLESNKPQAANVTASGITAVTAAYTEKYQTRCIKGFVIGIQVPVEDINLTANGCTDADKQALSKLYWAEGNLKSTGTNTSVKDYVWADTQEDYGYYYTWKSSYTGNRNTSSNGVDPCTLLKPDEYGTDWRTPSYAELQMLSRCTDKVFTSKEGAKGMWFMNNPKGLFLPAGGGRGYLDGCGTTDAGDGGVNGHYWSKEESSSTSGYYLRFFNGNVDISTNVKKNGYSVRCVQNE